jgi:ATP-dependent exoDNAse (exonuclease V) alpha subunit
MAIHDELKAFRLQQSRAKGQPAFCVFGNKVLDAIAAVRPHTLRDLQAVPGMGPAKVKEYGEGIVAICTRHGPGVGLGGLSMGAGAAPAAKRQRGPDPIAPRFGEAAASDLALGSATQAQRISACASGAAAEIHASELSAEQRDAAARALSRENLFITGAAGTGKSFLMRYVIQELKKRSSGAEGTVAVTAPTGIAAVNIGGSTIHSFSGIGLGRGDPANILARVRKSQKASTNWKQASVLVLDEISMLSAELFDLLDFIGKSVRQSDRPFGGLQLILCGDFLQLPP